MPDPTQKPVLLTGASGVLGTVLANALAERGWSLRLTDIRPFTTPLPAGASFIRADLADGPAILRMAEGCGTILHFGGISVEQPFEDVYGPNIRGLYHAFEAARREDARMVFASSNHTIGFHPRTDVLDDTSAYRPDGYYGLSKVYGEGMAQLYWDKHGIETVSLRIGSCRAEPSDERMLATWLSYPDLITLVERAATADDVGHSKIWGASNNTRMTWWGADAREALGWAPKDNAERWAGTLEGVVSDHHASEDNQGGSYCAMGYSRDAV
jgi:uronate dehydrogenase